ncbi:MAG: DUF1566 domain-containing protein [Acidobacteria bacterium]|nr:DUF1566 domain-containing protein [Acidobacteriota bacterium]
MTLRLRRGAFETELPDITAVKAALSAGKVSADDEVWDPVEERWRRVSDIVPTSSPSPGVSMEERPPRIVTDRSPEAARGSDGSQGVVGGLLHQGTRRRIAIIGVAGGVVLLVAVAVFVGYMASRGGASSPPPEPAPGSPGAAAAAGAEHPVDCTEDYLDARTGLCWQSSPSSRAMAWDEAKRYCAALESDGDGPGGWRLPTIGELRSLIRGCPETETGGDCGATDSCTTEACETDACSGCSDSQGPGVGGSYWPSELTPAMDEFFYSSTPVSGTESGGAWGVWSLYGSVMPLNVGDVGDSAGVRCVGRAAAGTIPRREDLAAGQEDRHAVAVEALSEPRTGSDSPLEAQGPKYWRDHPLPPETSDVVAVEPWDPSWGPASAPVTIVAFADYLGREGWRLVDTLRVLHQAYGDRVRFVFRSRVSEPTSRLFSAAMLAAQEMGAFDAFSEQIFGDAGGDVRRACRESERRCEAALRSQAERAGIDATAFARTADSPQTRRRVEEDGEEAVRLRLPEGVTVFVNGRSTSNRAASFFGSWIDQILDVESETVPASSNPPLRAL